MSGENRRPAPYAVILAGGGGTRLWPLSDPDRPKPFLPLLPDGRSLLRATIERITANPELAISERDITVVTSGRYERLVRSQTTAAVLCEPRGRNTAPAIALATLAIERPDDDVLIVLPADHLVEREEAFRAVLADACTELAPGAFGVASPLVTLGAHPTYPATGYGYLVPDRSRGRERPAGSRLESSPLAAFQEKPDEERAAELLRDPGVAWNAGIFVGRRGAFRAAFEKYTTLISSFDGHTDPVELAAAYEHVEGRSVDYAVMEPAAADGRVLMAAIDVGWSDLGSWTALVNALVGGGYAAPARVIPAGEAADLDDGDLAIIRTDGGALELRRGPLHLTSPRPVAFLPRARQHERVLDKLLARVNEWSSKPLEAEVRA